MTANLCWVHLGNTKEQRCWSTKQKVRNCFNDPVVSSSLHCLHSGPARATVAVVVSMGKEPAAIMIAEAAVNSLYFLVTVGREVYRYACNCCHSGRGAGMVSAAASLLSTVCNFSDLSLPWNKFRLLSLWQEMLWILFAVRVLNVLP